MLELRAHARQFLIGPQFVSVRADWRRYEIDRGVILSADPALRIQELFSADGVRYLLLGHALLSDQRVRVEDAFAETPSDDVIDWSSSWSGRWLLIAPQCCIPDASGSLGLFYRLADEAVWLSSSVALLANHLPGQSVAQPIPWGVVHERAMDWIPAPLSSRQGILKLPPFRKIALRTGHISRLRIPSLQSASENPIDEIASRLVTLARNTTHLDFAERHVALTGGLDTRTILSAFVAADVPFETVTAVAPWSSAADRRLPPRISSVVGAPHTLRRPAQIDEAVLRERRQVIDEHTGGQTAATCVEHCARATGAASATVQFGGLCFELGRCYFWHRLRSPEAANDFFREPVHERWHAAMSDWVGSLCEEIPLRIDWRDRFYLEQRLGGWFSANEQCNDIVPTVHLHLANCARLFQLMLLRPEADRRSGATQTDIIRTLAPELAQYPVNPPSLPEIARKQSRRIVRRLSRSWRALGIRPSPAR